jgi:hypothetical protein
MKRYLLRNGEQIGAVELVDDTATFSDAAETVFDGYRRRLGDTGAARVLLDRGWSNGQGTVFLGDLSDVDPE